MKKRDLGYGIRLALFFISAALVGALSGRLKEYGSAVYISASFGILLAFFLLGLFISSKLASSKDRH